MKLRSCIIGLGQVGIKFDLEKERKSSETIWTHFRAYEKLNNKYELVAAVDPDQNSWEFALQRNPNIKCFSTIEDMLNSDIAIDVVSICSPDKFHFENLKNIMPYVRGIFLEKPITAIDETDEAKTFLENHINTKIIYVNYYKRAEPLVIKMTNSIEENNEKIKYIECRYSGPFMAVGSHAIDLLNFVLDIKEIKAVAKHEDSEGDGYSSMMLGKNDELVNLSYTGKRHEFIFELEVITDKSSYELTNNLQEYTYKKLINSTQYKGYKEYKLQEYKYMQNENRFIGYLKNMYENIIDDNKSNTNLKKSIKTQELMKKIIDV